MLKSKSSKFQYILCGEIKRYRETAYEANIKGDCAAAFAKQMGETIAIPPLTLGSVNDLESR